MKYQLLTPRECSTLSLFTLTPHPTLPTQNTDDYLLGSLHNVTSNAYKTSAFTFILHLENYIHYAEGILERKYRSILHRKLVKKREYLTGPITFMYYGKTVFLLQC